MQLCPHLNVSWIICIYTWSYFRLWNPLFASALADEYIWSCFQLNHGLCHIFLSMWIRMYPCLHLSYSFICTDSDLNIHFFISHINYGITKSALVIYMYVLAPVWLYLHPIMSIHIMLTTAKFISCPCWLLDVLLQDISAVMPISPLFWFAQVLNQAFITNWSVAICFDSHRCWLMISIS